MAGEQGKARTRGGRRALDLVLLATLACALWGSAVPMVRLGYQQMGISSADAGSQLVFGGTRFMFSGLAVTVAWSLAHRQVHVPRGRELGVVAQVAATQTFGQYLLYYQGLAHATGVNGSIVQGIGVFTSFIMSALVFRLESLTARKLLGCAIGFVGLLVAGVGGASAGSVGFSLGGEGVVMLSACFASVAAVVLRRNAGKADTVMVCGWQFMLGGAGLVLVGQALGGRLMVGSVEAVGILTWLVMVSAVAYGVWSYLLGRYDVSQVSAFEFLIPIFGVLFSLALLGPEGTSVGWHTVAALALIAGGILLVERR